MTDLEALYATPSAAVPPHTPAEEVQAASLLAFATDTPPGNALGWWLRDTATIHFPDSSGQHCERDSDDWPCHDIRAALKLAEHATLGTRCGTGWTRGRAYRDLARHLHRDPRDTTR